MRQNKEGRPLRNRITTYLNGTIKDATGVKFAHEIAGERGVVSRDQEMVTINAKALGAGAADIALPIASRVFRAIDEKDKSSDTFDESAAWMGYPASIFAEFAITATAFAIARDQGSFRDGVEIFSAIKATEIGIATVGRDIFKLARMKAESVLFKPQ